MSHFSVLVIGNKTLDEQLDPYWELDLPKEKIANDYRANFRLEIKKNDVEDYIRREIIDDEWVNRPEKKEVAEKFKKLFETQQFSTILYDWGGYVLNPKTGDYGIYRNPDAMWDWYEVGGRWSGQLKLKPGCKGVLGRKSRANANQTIPVECFDVAKFADVDWDSMNANTEKKVLLKRFWEIIVEGQKPITKDEEEQMAYELYKPEYYLDRYKTKDRYVELESKFTTYAVITEDGRWHAPGTMGWWGISSDDAQAYTKWQETYFEQFLAHLHPETKITMVDCHI